jgi:hypothetical protein
MSNMKEAYEDLLEMHQTIIALSKRHQTINKLMEQLSWEVENINDVLKTLYHDYQNLKNTLGAEDYE